MQNLRARFPVLERFAYLNAGTCGPLADNAADAAREALEDEVARGRFTPHWDARLEHLARLRAMYAEALGAREDEVAITNSTSEGIGRVITGLGLRPGDEVLSSDEEHPGLLGPLKALRAAGVEVRLVALEEIHEHVSARTRLVACSHVGWVSGKVAPAGLAEVDVPVVYDGAQGVGAIRVDVKALRCAAYAGAGQKWLCGADATGMLYVEPGFGERVRNLAPTYANFEDTTGGLDAPLKETAARFDTTALARETVAVSAASTSVLAEAGFGAVQEQALGMAERFASALAERGRHIAKRGPTPLVAWEEPDSEAVVERLREAGVIVRNIPGTPLVRASVGAWNDETDLERLLDALP